MKKKGELSQVERLFRDLDKCSPKGHTKVVYSPWGKFKFLGTGKNGRRYSVSESILKNLKNGGSYKISTIMNKIKSA